ncbi:MAG TPA: hypothetical protein VLM85_13900 [Polyangiaceae bacterium]|nr:hypothetical protein [Polyangiaceae bacterium]
MSCKPGEREPSHLAHDLVITAVATVAFVLLSLPVHWSFDFWAEAGPAWIAYFAVGVLLCVYVLLAFLRATRTLLHHAHEEAPRGRP